MNARLREMRLSDLQLKSCTRWRAPDGVVYLEVPYVLPFYLSVAAGAASTPALSEAAEAPSPARGARPSFSVEARAFADEERQDEVAD